MNKINLDDIGSLKAVKKLREYKGINPYIKKLKITLEEKGKISLTSAQSKYILDNYQREPDLINRVIEISEYLGEELKKANKLPFVPKRIKFEYILGENDKTFHVYGKLTQKQKKSGMYFIPKTQVIDDPYFEEIDIDFDFDKYEALDTFVNSEGVVGRKFYDLQKTGIKFLSTRDGCMLADDMGLGKSLQAIVAALESGAKKILIVCPASVKINWEREINYFQCNDVNIIDNREWKTAKFTIINFDILKNFHALPSKVLEKKYIRKSEQPLLSSNFDLCIIDEAHKLKNKDSKRGAIMAEVCKEIKKVWLLTGTPVANRPMDFYNLLKLIKAPITKNWMFYAKRYCEGRQITTTNPRTKQKRRIWLTNGASNLPELARKVKHTYIRRLKDEIKDMPDKIITPTFHKFDANQLKEYNSLWDEYLIERAEKKKRGEPERALVELGLLRKFVAMEAIPETIKMAEDIIEQGHKVIIFTNFTDELLDLSEHFAKNSVIHYGGMSNAEKQKSVDDFQNNKRTKVFIGNILSAGVGITLTAGTYVIFNSFDWVPGNNAQAEDRPYRLGQKNNVNVYYQLFENSVSTKMWNIIHRKKEIIATIMSEENVTEEGALGIIVDKIIEDE